MSNEYKDWLWDTVQDIVLERGLADKTLNTSTTRIVDGIKDGQPVKYEVWYDDDTGKWRVEHRETDK